MATQENFNLSKTISSSSVVLPNTILLIALVYFSFILEQDSATSSTLRKIIYCSLIVLDILFLIYINTDYFFFKKVKTNLTEFLVNLWRKVLGKSGVEIQEKPDEIREFVEKSVHQNILSQEKFREPLPNYVGNINSRDLFQSYGQPIYANQSKYEREKEILTSKAKSKIFLENNKLAVDERFISGKLQSPSKSHFDNREYGQPFKPQQNIFNKYSQYNLVPSDIDFSNKNYSCRMIKSLQLSSKYTSKLKLGNENKDDYLSSIERLDLNNYERYIENLKSHISHKIITSLLDDHYENIDHLNRFLENSLNVQIVESMVDDTEWENFYEELSSKIRDTNLSFSTVTVKNIKPPLFQSFRNEKQPFYTSGFNLLQESQIPSEKIYLKIFFGDNEKLLFMIDRIDEKLKNIKIQRERTRMMQNREINEYREKGGIANLLFSSKKDLQDKSEIPYGTGKKKMNLNNPLKNQNKFNVMSDYADLVQTHNKSIEDNLNILKELIELRLELNSKFTPFFVKVESNKHMQLLLEYSVWRLKDLKLNNFINYKNDSGGNFNGENWISAFATDSQIVSSIFLKYMEEIYEENEIRQRTFLVNWPLVPKMEKNSNSLILYQMNPPSCEPHFNVYYEDEFYNCVCGRENFFYAAVIFLHIMRIRMTTIVKKLKIDDFMDSIFKY